MTGEKGDGSAEEVWGKLLETALCGMLGVDVERLNELVKQAEERERDLQERERNLQERERALQEREQQQNEPVQETLAPDKETPAPDKETPAKPSSTVKVSTDGLAIEIPKVEIDLQHLKIKTSAEIAYDNIAKGKDQVTLADLKATGVNLKTDLQPTIKAMTKDNPDKLAELAPKGLGDENAPVSKEFAMALISRAQTRETIARHNGKSR